MGPNQSRLNTKSPFPFGRNASQRQRLTALVFVMIIAAIGSYILTSSFAAGSTSAVEPENGTLSSSGVSIGNDSTASGGKYVVFGTASSGGTDPLVVADGDIACDPNASGYNGGAGTSGSCVELATSNLAISLKPTAVLALGDNVYECGGLKAFQQSYGPSWGRLNSITHPAVGTHEYIATTGQVNGVTPTDCDTTGKAMGYFTYFGSAAGSPSQGYYSYDIGTWHLIALNSSCSHVGGCNSGSPQYTWLQNDLTAHTNLCTLAYWHIPLYSRDISGGTANLAMQQIWQLLYQHGADVVLSAHSHNHERFQPMDQAGNVDTTKGILEIIAGEGGANHTPYDITDSPSAFNTKYNFTPGLLQPVPVAANNTEFGLLALTLHPTSMDYKFVSVKSGGYSDSGSFACHK